MSTLELASPDSKTVLARHPLNRWSSFGIALLLELILIAITLAWLMTHETNSQVHNLAIELLSDPPSPEPVKPEPPKPPTPKIEPKPSKTQPQIQPPAPQITPAVVAPTETPVTSTPNAFTQATPVAAPNPPEPKLSGPSDEYIARVKAAVQSAFYYPMAAIEMGLHGRVRVGFNLKGTVMSEPRILSSSGLGIIDRAALQAVQKANYPLPNAELRERTLSYEVWIEFKP
jgi:TonB family protein